VSHQPKLELDVFSARPWDDPLTHISHRGVVELEYPIMPSLVDHVAAADMSKAVVDHIAQARDLL